MHRISLVSSLLQFHERVLYYGDPTRNNLNSALFFNQIFASNTDEMFQKYDCTEVYDEYVQYMIKCINNIDRIVKSFHGTVLEHGDSFENRFATYQAISGSIMTKVVSDNSKYRFRNGCIYYVGVSGTGERFVSYIDMKRAIYHEPICCQFKDKLVYWKTDECIAEYIARQQNAVHVVAIKVTTNHGHVTKVEYNGSTSTIKQFLSLFGSALVLSNPYLYTNDISQVNSTKDEQELQVYQKIDPTRVISEDKLIEYPNDSFDDYLDFIRTAVSNPDTAEIYITLYRIGSDPTIYYVLRDAVRRGVKVQVNIELCATGEDINQLWVDEFRRAGIVVTTYASGTLKVHSKVTLVKFNNGLSVAQIGTGNYHTRTTTQYTDLSLMTADSVICYEAEKLFQMFSGQKVSFNNNFLVTRYNARKVLIGLIDREAKPDGYICFKCNSLDDDEIISHLYSAAQAGCTMELIVRGICTWVPAEFPRVTIRSIVWDKLEHSRVYSFGKSNPTVYIGSLDLITHKLDERVEVLVKIKDPNVLIQMCDYINRYITNNQYSWVLQKNGRYKKES